MNTEQRNPMALTENHVVKGTPLKAPFPDGLEVAYFGMGCFWGAEYSFWQREGVYSTAVGYAGGELEHPTYRDVCGGGTEHAEIVMVVYDPEIIAYEDLLKVFWKGRHPGKTQRGAMRRDQYRSVIYTTTPEQAAAAAASVERYQQGLGLKEDEQVAIEVGPAPTFYYAEQYHQQYQARH